MREKYESLSLAILKELAKARGLKGTSALRKAQLIEVMLEQDEKDKAALQEEASESVSSGNPDQESEKGGQKQNRRNENGRSQKSSGRPRRTDSRLTEIKLDSREETAPKSGERPPQNIMQPQGDKRGAQIQGESSPLQDVVRSQDENRSQNLSRPQDESRQQNAGQPLDESSEQNTGRLQGESSEQNTGRLQGESSEQNAGRLQGESSEQNTGRLQDESGQQNAGQPQGESRPKIAGQPQAERLQTAGQQPFRSGVPRDSEEPHTRRPLSARNTDRPRMSRTGTGRAAASSPYNREDSRDRTQTQRRRTPENGSRSTYERNSQERSYANTGSGEERSYRLSQGNGEDRGYRLIQGNGEEWSYRLTPGNAEERGGRFSQSAGEDRGNRTLQGTGEERGNRTLQSTGEERGNRTLQGTGEERGNRTSQSAGEDRGNRTLQGAGESRSFDSVNRDAAAGVRAGDGQLQSGHAAEDPSAEGSRMADADRPPAELSQLDSGQSVSGILEVMPDGYGFIRSDNYLPGENDVYVSPSQIRRFNLKTGDIISGNTRIKSQQEKFSALLYLKKINGLAPSEAAKRFNFEDMTPVFPNERLRMEREQRGTAMRTVDLFSPIGKGQRGMIVSPPKAGKTTLLKDIARSVLTNNPEMRLLILLIDERPEEVTDIKEAIRGENVEVIYSTFDETPEHHKRVSEMVIERAKRLVEQKEDVIILLDSITRLARAYNLTVPPSGRTLSGGLDPAALHMPKRFFGAARNMREGGSLTILATALVDTGSKMDDVVYEEFKGTGNMELVLDRKLSERRVFPAIDIPKSGTRREDLLLDREEQEAIYYMRRALNGMKSDDAVESIINMLLHTRDNRDLVTRVRRQKGV